MVEKTESQISSNPPENPYKGLMPYTEEDATLFFGRDKERRILTDNLVSQPLTLFYGSSGVGKSSLLRAGVATHFGEKIRENLAEQGKPKLAIVVYSAWRDKDPVARLIQEVEKAVTKAKPTVSTEPPRLVASGQSLAKALRLWTERLGGQLLIVLDQFEDYFLYHEEDDPNKADGNFAAEFSRTACQPGLSVNFLISIREESLAKLDLFKLALPNLFNNRLWLQPLMEEERRAAIIEPLKEYNRRLEQTLVRSEDSLQTSQSATLKPSSSASIEPELVDEILQGIREGEIVLGWAGQGKVEKRAPTQPETHFVAPYLQLVMTRLWEDGQKKLLSQAPSNQTLVLNRASLLSDTLLRSIVSRLVLTARPWLVVVWMIPSACGM